MMETLHFVLNKWEELFGPSGPARVVRAPGRINIIGEHTDYNDGWVLPGATSNALYLLIHPHSENHWVSLDFDEQYHSQQQHKPTWAKYIEGVIDMLQLHNQTFRIVFGGDLPVGAGVSSSSALLCGLFLGLGAYCDVPPEKKSIVNLSGRVEKEIIGLQGGIMDQFAILFSKKDNVMLLDCRTREFEYLDAHLSGHQWFLINTNVKHHLAESDYNIRANECRQVVEQIRMKYPDITHLRDVTEEILTEFSLNPILHNRARFVVRENARVHKMKFALSSHDSEMVGSLLNDSHIGLRDEYEVSCRELDVLQSFLTGQQGVKGCRMMGGGFGGCVIGLVEEKVLNETLKKTQEHYYSIFSTEATPILFELGGGAGVIQFT